MAGFLAQSLCLGVIAVLPKYRTRRSGSLRRTLTCEALEERTLLDGVIIASLDAETGLLQITGDNSDNQLTIAPAPTPEQIRISGAIGSSTAINGAAYDDFALADITGIRITLQNGQNNITITGFSVPGDLSILYGNSADSFAVQGFAAHNINILFSGLALGGATGIGKQNIDVVGGEALYCE